MREADTRRLDIANKAEADIEAVLTDDQKKPLPNFKKDLQIFQQARLLADLIADLKLTDDQRTKIRA